MISSDDLAACDCNIPHMEKSISTIRKIVSSYPITCTNIRNIRFVFPEDLSETVKPVLTFLSETNPSIPSRIFSP